MAAPRPAFLHPYSLAHPPYVTYELVDPGSGRLGWVQYIGLYAGQPWHAELGGYPGAAARSVGRGFATKEAAARALAIEQNRRYAGNRPSRSPKPPHRGTYDSMGRLRRRVPVHHHRHGR